MDGQDLSSFSHWLRSQTARRDAVGALARVVATDLRWPLSAKTVESYARYLQERAATDTTVAALFDAWAEYQAERDVRQS